MSRVFVTVLASISIAACATQGENAANAEPASKAVASTARGGSPAAKLPKAKANPSRGAEHAVYSLIDNRLTAHWQRGGGLVVPGGSAGFAKYIRFGRSKLSWKLSAKRDGVGVAGVLGRTGRMFVPLSAKQAGADVSLSLRIYSGAAQRIGFRINGNRKAEVSVQADAGWSTVTTTLSSGVFKVGENEILLFVRKPTQLAWMQVGGTQGTDDLGAAPSAKSLPLTKGGGYAYYVMVPKQGRLVADVSAGCKVSVSATSSLGSATGTLEGANSSVDLAKLAGQVVRLELRNDSCPRATLANASLSVPGAAAVVKKPKAPKHVLFVVIDSLRADRLRVINPKARPETPVIDQLAESSTVFTQAYVQGNESRASHASMWTSLYPVVHRMIPGGSPKRLSTKWYSIDELMKDVGMFTSGVSANGYVTPKRGFGTKWDKYRNHIHDGGGLFAERLLTKVWAALAGRETKPWFTYVGFIDTHVSWRAKSPWFEKYAVAGYSGRFKKVASGVEIGKVATGKIKLSDIDKDQVRALYDSNVSYQDAQLGTVIAKLQSLEIADDTMIIITADHGDELFEHGRVGHGASLKETLVHVPLIVHYPPLFPAGTRSEGAETVDIVPTLADAFGKDMDDNWQGESLIPLAQGVTAGYPRLSFASKYEDIHVGRLGDWKLRIPGAGSSKLYKLSSDPNENTNVSTKNPNEARWLADAVWMMRAYNKDWRKWKWGNAANVTAAFAAHFGE